MFVVYSWRAYNWKQYDKAQAAGIGATIQADEWYAFSISLHLM